MKIKRNQLIIIILQLLSTVIKKKMQILKANQLIGRSSNWYE